jgi:pilus assembly protein Flp/PilA
MVPSALPAKGACKVLKRASVIRFPQIYPGAGPEGRLPGTTLERRNIMLYAPKERGQGLVEYALILVLVAVVVIVILALLGPAIGNVFSNIVSQI